MPTAHEVATELRKFADRWDSDPEAKIAKPSIWWYFYSKNDKDMFKAIARLLPRPISKEIEHPDSSRPMMVVRSNGEIVDFYIHIPQSATCRIIEPARPAVYDCESILSEAEEAEITAS